MAINEIVLVAYRNGHGHVVIRWGHGLLGKIRERRERRRQKKKKKKIRLDTSDFGKGNVPKTRCLTGDRKGINGQPRIGTSTCRNGRRYGRREARQRFQGDQGALHKIQYMMVHDLAPVQYYNLV